MDAEAVNIGDVEDEFYRYKMPRLLTKIEGRGNGIKTVLVNAVDVAKSLKRPVTFLVKFCGNSLCAQSKWDAKNEKAIVNGAHENEKVSEMVLQFVKKFVLCGHCKNPETNIHVRSKDITLECIACGNTTIVDPMDKLCKFIRTQASMSGEKKGKKKGGKVEREEKDEKDEKIEEAVESGPDMIDGVPVEVPEADVDALARKIDEMRKLEAQENPVTRLEEFMMKDPDAEDVRDELEKIQEIHQCDNKGIIDLMFSAKLITAENFRENGDFHVEIMAPFCEKDPGAQKSLLRRLARMLGKEMSPGHQFVPVFMMKMYEEDGFDEDIVLKWYDDGSTSKIGTTLRKAAEKFVTWLREADEEDDEEDDEEEGGDEDQDGADDD